MYPAILIKGIKQKKKQIANCFFLCFGSVFCKVFCKSVTYFGYSLFFKSKKQQRFYSKQSFRKEVIELNRKILLIFASLFILSMMLTPLAVAKPGAEKSNEKFDYFELLCSGAPDTASGIVAETFIDDTLKTRHVSGRGWLPGSVTELAVGEETFTMSSTPFSVDYTTTFDAIALFNNDGSNKRTAVKLVDVVTLYEDDEAIGTLVLMIEAFMIYPAPPEYMGTVVGYGTGALEGVHVSAEDIGLITAPGPDGQYTRIGTITGWPEEITNIV